MIIHGSSAWNLVSSLTNFDEYKGEQVTTEIWGGLYSDRESQFAALKERGANTITPQKAGPLCYLTATFLASSGGSGGGGGVTYITIRWDVDADILEMDLKRIRAWGTDDSLSDSDNEELAKKLLKADKRLDAGDWDGFKADTFLATTLKYGTLKAAGITGFMRANYSITKTTTWTSRADVDSYVSYGSVWKVVSFAETGYPYKEPTFQDSLADGTWGSYSCKWLTMPPRISSQNRSHTLTESWLGAREWKEDLYDNA